MAAKRMQQEEVVTSLRCGVAGADVAKLLPSAQFHTTRVARVISGNTNPEGKNASSMGKYHIVDHTVSRDLLRMDDELHTPFRQPSFFPPCSRPLCALIGAALTCLCLLLAV
jgi:hypothetical protein